MIVVMEKDASEVQIDRVIASLVERGFDVYRSTGVERTVLGAVGEKVVDVRDFELLEGVQQVVRVTQPYKLCTRVCKPEGSIIQVKNVSFGGPEIPVIAGPCAVESRLSSSFCRTSAGFELGTISTTQTLLGFV